MLVAFAFAKYKFLCFKYLFYIKQKFLSPVLKYFITRTQGEEHETQFLGYYDGMRKLAHKYGSEPFQPYREYLDEEKNSASSANIKTCVTTLIDELEGRR